MRIWKFEGHDLDELRAALDDRNLVYYVRIADDDGGLKIKVNEDMWSLAYGKLEMTWTDQYPAREDNRIFADGENSSTY